MISSHPFSITSLTSILPSPLLTPLQHHQPALILKAHSHIMSFALAIPCVQNSLSPPQGLGSNGSDIFSSAESTIATILKSQSSPLALPSLCPVDFSP